MDLELTETCKCDVSNCVFAWGKGVPEGETGASSGVTSTSQSAHNSSSVETSEPIARLDHTFNLDNTLDVEGNDSNPFVAEDDHNELENGSWETTVSDEIFHPSDAGDGLFFQCPSRAPIKQKDGKFNDLTSSTSVRKKPKGNAHRAECNRWPEETKTHLGHFGVNHKDWCVIHAKEDGHCGHHRFTMAIHAFGMCNDCLMIDPLDIMIEL